MLDLDFSDRVVDVIEEGFDAVVRFSDAGDSRLMSRALGTYRRRLVAAPAYLTAKGVPLTPDDLKAHACLHHRFPTSGKLERWPLWPKHAGQWQADTQCAARGVLRLRQFKLGRFDLRKDTPAAFEE